MGWSLTSRAGHVLDSSLAPNGPPLTPNTQWVRTSDTESFDDERIAVYSFETGQRKILVDGGRRGIYCSGHVIYIRAGTLYAAPFDLGKLAVTGTAVPVVDGVFDAAC